MKKLNFYVRLLIFLVLNFGALALGNALQDAGPFSNWYQSLNIAPWTPPGWFFGLAWTTIMLCFSIYMARLVAVKDTTTTYLLFAIQFLLNVSWNAIFFKYHLVLLALAVISSLTILLGYLLMVYSKKLPAWKWLLAPYFLWLIVATSLNLYVLLYN